MEETIDVSSQCSFNEGYIHLPVAAERFGSLPKTLEVLDTLIELKTEFHVSLMNVDFIASLMGARAGEPLEEAKERIVSIFYAYAERQPIFLSRFLDDFRFVSKEERRSVVIRCEVSGVNGFFEECEEAFGVVLPRQPFHVTIYTLGHNKGIGINSEEEMAGLERVSLPEIRDRLGFV